jgi:hypothetical protein
MKPDAGQKRDDDRRKRVGPAKALLESASDPGLDEDGRDCNSEGDCNAWKEPGLEAAQSGKGCPG